jgi:signal transduction histidine kinase
MVNTISAMDRLLKKLSLISEINQPSGFKRINLRRTVDDLLYGMSKMARENNIKVITNCPGNIAIESYPIIVESILSNLIENAIFFTALKNGSENSVEISASVNDGQLQISVSDNGVGIDASYHERVFDMFFKGDEYSKGNGLGLYIVRKSVEALDGRISLESIRGQYTRFTITLPTTVNDAHVVDQMVG